MQEIRKLCEQLIFFFRYLSFRCFYSFFLINPIRFVLSKCRFIHRYQPKEGFHQLHPAQNLYQYCRFHRTHPLQKFPLRENPPHWKLTRPDLRCSLQNHTFPCHPLEVLCYHLKSSQSLRSKKPHSVQASRTFSLLNPEFSFQNRQPFH